MQQHEFMLSFSGRCSASNGVHSSRKEFAPGAANSFLEEVTHLRSEAKKGKIVELLHLNIYPFTFIVFIRNVLAVADLLPKCRAL